MTLRLALRLFRIHLFKVLTKCKDWSLLQAGETWGDLGARYCRLWLKPHGKPPYFFGFARRYGSRRESRRFRPIRRRRAMGGAGLFTRPAHPSDYDRDHHAITDANALRPRMACRAILRVATGSGLPRGRDDESFRDARPRDRVEFFGLPPEGSVSCHTCLDGACDPEFHASSKRIRAWMIRRIADAQTPPPVAKPRVFVPPRRRCHPGTAHRRNRENALSRLGGRAREGDEQHTRNCGEVRAGDDPAGRRRQSIPAGSRSAHAGACPRAASAAGLLARDQIGAAHHPGTAVASKRAA